MSSTGLTRQPRETQVTVFSHMANEKHINDSEATTITLTGIILCILSLSYFLRDFFYFFLFFYFLPVLVFGNLESRTLPCKEVI